MRSRERIESFLAEPSFAVVGASRQRGSNPGCGIADKLEKAGKKVFLVNPNADEIDGRPCYRSMSAVPETPAVAFFVSHPNVTEQAVKDAVDAGVKRIWFHKTFGDGSYSSAAEKLALDAGAEVLPGGCPMMFQKPVDPFHFCFRYLLRIEGRLERHEPAR